MTNEKSRLISYQNIVVKQPMSFDDNNENDNYNYNNYSDDAYNPNRYSDDDVEDDDDDDVKTYKRGHKGYKYKLGLLGRIQLYLQLQSGPIQTIVRFIILLLLIAIITFCILYNQSTVKVHHHDHTIPTLLSIRSNDIVSSPSVQSSSVQSSSSSSSSSNPVTVTKVGEGLFVNSLSNVLYDVLKLAEFEQTDDGDNINDANNDSNANENGIQYTIQTDKQMVSFHENITISWEKNNNHNHNSNNGNSNENSQKVIIDNSNDDVIALYCPATEKDPKKFKDAATISQIKSTNIFNNFNNIVVEGESEGTGTGEGDDDDDYDIDIDTDNEDVGFLRRKMSPSLSTLTTTTTISRNNHNQWFIPSFPLIKEDTCEFRLWIRGHNHYHADEMGGQIATFTLGAKSKPFDIEYGNGRIVPMTIHLALTTSSSEMMVQFSTGTSNKGGNIPIVVYHQDEDMVRTLGTDGNDGTDNNTDGSSSTSSSNSSSSNSSSNNTGLQMQHGNSTSYEAQDMCQKPAIVEEPGKFSSPGLLHSVTMKDLDPNTKYYYKVGILTNDNDLGMIVDNDSENDSTNKLPLNNDIVWSDVYSFYSPLVNTKDSSSSSSSEPFVFLVYADQGAIGYGNDDGGDRTSLWAMREIELNNIRSVHHIGDLSYAQGASHMWDKWLDMVSVFSTRVPLMIGVGNHEYDHTDGGENGKDPSGLRTSYGFEPKWGNFGADSNGECGVPVAKRFTMPANGNSVFWYSYISGNVKTIMLSSEHDLSPTSKQHKWLENELSSVDRSITPWVIVEAHRPMYNNEDVPANTKVGIGMRKEFEILLVQYNVDLFLSGHYHSYMRSCAGLYQSICNNGGPIHITVGTAGAELDRGVPLLRNGWTEAYLLEWGYGRITSISDNELKWEFVTDIDGKVQDSVTISK